MSEVECLGQWITREGVKPMTDKVESTLGIQRPHAREEMHRFMGMINFYRNREPILCAPWSKSLIMLH